MRNANRAGRTRRWLTGWVAAVVALTTPLLVTPVSAQAPDDSVTLDQFRAGETVDDGFHISRPDDIGHIKFHGQVHIDYADDPLVYETMQGTADTERARVVSQQLVGTVGLAFGLFDRVVIYAGLPLSIMMNGDDAADLAMFGIPQTADEGFGLGDLYFGARVRIIGEMEDTFALGLQLSGTAPLAGDDQFFRGDNTLSFHPELLAEIRAGEKVRITMNLGFRIRDNAVYTGLEAGDELTWGIGLTAPLLGSRFRRENRLDLHVQAYGALGTADFFGREESPIEATAGLKFHHTSGFTVGVAGGPGLQRGYGSPDFRVIGMLGFGMPRDLEGEPVVEGPGDRDGDGILDDVDACPDQPEDFDGDNDEDGCPDVEGDRDGDGIMDADDQCPDEPEDVDTFEDTNGCPDPDNDGDGVLDVDDGAPMDPEDPDGWEDPDGVPDPDNDGDGILDANDNCPNEAGPMENRGCPDADRDGDTVVDRLDNCPDEAGSPDNQGCRQRQLVRIEAGRLEILDKVYFRTNSDRIRSRSFPLLNNVAQVINSHPELTSIRVEGHTDSRGDHDYNMDLSQRRAEAVVRYLTGRGGVDASRLSAQGFGPDNPIDSNDTRNGRAANRRVEFNIPNAAASGISQQNSGPSADTIDI